MICDPSVLAWVMVGMILGAPIGVLGTLVWAAICTDWTRR